MTTYEGFDQWQHPEKNNSLTQVLEGEQISTMAKISASTESQSPWSVDLPLSSALDAKISHPNHQSSYQNTDHTSTHRCQISNGVGTPYPSSRLSSAPPHNSTQLDTIVSYDAEHDTSHMPHGSHESHELGAATLQHPSLDADNTSGLALHLPQELPISNVSQEPQQAPATDAATPIAQLGHSMVTRSQVGTTKPNTKYLSKDYAYLADSISPESKHVKSSLKHPSLLTTPEDSTEPISVKQAITRPNWVLAMREELDALERNQTWVLVPRTNDMNVVGLKWVFKTKLKSDGSIDRFKA